MPVTSPGDRPAAGAAPRVVLVDDSALLREGVARLLADAGLDVRGTAGDGERLLELVRREEPDVAVVDIRLPPTWTDEGLLVARRLRADHPGLGVLVLSQHVQVSYAVELLAGGADGVGYLLKDRVADVGEFVAAVRRVAEGGSALDPQIVTALVGRRRDPLALLTGREREVLALMAEGLANAAIADRLVVSERTVEKHVNGIFAKLQLTERPDGHRRVLAVLSHLGALPSHGG